MFIPAWAIALIVVGYLYRNYTIEDAKRDLFGLAFGAVLIGVPLLLYVFWDQGGAALVGFVLLAGYLWGAWRALIPLVIGMGTAMWIGSTLGLTPGWFVLMFFGGGIALTGCCALLIERYLPWMALPLEETKS